MNDRTYLYGAHPFEEALLKNPACLRKVWLQSSEYDPAVIQQLRALNIAFQSATDEDLKRLVGPVPHQGVVADVFTDKLYTPIDECHAIQNPTPNTMVVILDELTDPYNMGAIIRSASGFGASAVIFPTHNQVPVTGTVIKASAGAVFSIPLIRVGNVNTTMRLLKDKGFWTYGLDMEGTNKLHTEKFTTPVAFVVGSEGAGIRTKTLELCDIHLSVPMLERTESLNASVAGSVCMYEWYSQHQYVPKR